MGKYSATGDRVLLALEPGTPYAARDARDAVECRYGFLWDFDRAWSQLQRDGRLQRVGSARKGIRVRWRRVPAAEAE